MLRVSELIAKIRYELMLIRKGSRFMRIKARWESGKQVEEEHIQVSIPVTEKDTSIKRWEVDEIRDIFDLNYAPIREAVPRKQVHKDAYTGKLTRQIDLYIYRSAKPHKNGGNNNEEV